MPRKLITKAKLAEIAGVSRAAVTKACAGALADAVDGKKIDLDHPKVAEWLGKAQKRKINKQPTTVAKTAKKPPLESVSELPDEKLTASAAGGADAAARTDGLVGLGEIMASMNLGGVKPDDFDVDSLADMTVREVCMRFGTFEQFKDLLKARETIEVIKLKEVQAAEKRGEYISRDLVSKHVIPMVDNAFARLVEDTPETLAGLSLALAQSSGSKMELADLIRANITKILKDVKANSVRVIQNA